MPAAQGASADSMVGERIGRYVITRELARGGMGVVYEAVHEDIGHRAAVKVLARDLSKGQKSRDYAGRFYDEARAVNIVQHPGIVKIFDFGMLREETVYIMMEYLEGESLWDRIVRTHQRAHQRMPVEETLRIGKQIASSLAAAHEKRIIHRDLKPENVILVPDPDVPGEERTKVLDFGIARFLDSTQRRTVAGMVMGTALYMSPEQCRGAENVDGKVDVYALGVMMYEMLSGRPPFEGEPSKVMVMHVTQPPPPLAERAPWVPVPVQQLIHEMLAKKPEERLTMAQVVQRVKQIEADGLVMSAPGVAMQSATVQLPQLNVGSGPYFASLRETTSRGRLSRPLLIAIAGAAPVLLVLVLWLWLGSSEAVKDGVRPEQPASPAIGEATSRPEKGQVEAVAEFQREVSPASPAIDGVEDGAPGSKANRAKKKVKKRKKR